MGGNITFTKSFKTYLRAQWNLFCHVQLFTTPWTIYSPWNSPGQSTGVGSLSLLQGIFPTQGSNPGLPHCRQILCQLSHKESPRRLEWVAYPFSNRSFQPRNQTRVSCIAGRLFTNWAIREGIVLSHYISIQIGQNQIDILPERRCRWPKSTWKDVQRH